MPHFIHLLPDAIANQIAAGEVVQRPSSVVKELLENAIDAGATNIKLIIKDAGSTLVQVIDNGSGMNEVDARMCFERHATSKIRTTEDLLAIHSLGFRGEALASIAAVAQVVLVSQTANEDLGTRIVIEGSKLKKQEVINTTKGTQISVKNIFFNVPARRNFLKSKAVENKHILDEFQRVALPRPEVAFSFYQNNKEVLQLPSTKLSQRIVHLLGKNYQNNLIPCKEATDLIQLHGYIGTPKGARKTRGGQFFFVNKRYIKSPYLHHAVKKAFEGLLAPDAFPFYVLFINIPPSYIDINVHPTKTEIKFQEEHLVYAIVTTTIKKALAVHHITPSLDFEQNINHAPFHFIEKTKYKAPITLDERNYTLFRGSPSTSAPFTSDLENNKGGLKMISNANQQACIDFKEVTKDTSNRANNKFLLHGKYIIAQVRSGILLIDQHAAQERILYEKMLHHLTKASGTTQQLLFPTKTTLSLSNFALIQACKKAICALGFRFDLTPPNTITITGHPLETSGQAPDLLLEKLLEQYKWYQQTLSLEQTESWARSIAKRGSLSYNKPLSSEEMDAIVDQLFACKNANYTPDGESIWVILSMDKLAELLKKESL